MSVIDFLPSYEKNKRRARMRSPEEYEKLRERVKSPEKIAEEMDKNEQLANLSFTLETEPWVKEALKEQIQEDVSQQGIEGLLEHVDDISEELQQSLEQGNFEVVVDTDPETNADQLALLPEGGVSERLPVKQQLSEQYAASLQGIDALEMMTIQVQVHGEVCGYMDVPKETEESHLLQIALTYSGVTDCLNGREVTKTEYTPELTLNLLTK